MRYRRGRRAGHDQPAELMPPIAHRTPFTTAPDHAQILPFEEKEPCASRAVISFMPQFAQKARDGAAAVFEQIPSLRAAALYAVSSANATITCRPLLEALGRKGHHTRTQRRHDDGHEMNHLRMRGVTAFFTSPAVITQPYHKQRRKWNQYIRAQRRVPGSTASAP
jgi:hypothetical protein